MLVNKTSEAAIFALVALNLDLELRSLLRELFSKGLELEELEESLAWLKIAGRLMTNLLLPGLQFFNQEVIALGDLAQLGVHASLEVNEVLPSLHRITRVLVPLAHDLVEMTHGNLGHQGLLHRAAEDGLDTGVASLK